MSDKENSDSCPKESEAFDIFKLLLPSLPSLRDRILK